MEEEWNPLPPISEEDKEPEEEEVIPPKEPEIVEIPEEPEIDEPIEEEKPEVIEESSEEIFFQKVRNARRTGLDARGQELFDMFDTIGKKSYVTVSASPAELEHLEKLGRIRRVP